MGRIYLVGASAGRKKGEGAHEASGDSIFNDAPCGLVDQAKCGPPHLGVFHRLRFIEDDATPGNLLEGGLRLSAAALLLGLAAGTSASDSIVGNLLVVAVAAAARVLERPLALGLRGGLAARANRSARAGHTAVLVPVLVPVLVAREV